MISIVIPTLNEEKYLPRLLNSIKQQSYSDYEIIVSDGGSSDKTKAIALESGVNFVESKKIKHPSYQRNEGAKIAKGELILFLDADSLLSSEFLGKAVKEFKDRGLSIASFYFTFNPNRWHYNIYAGISNFVCFLKQFNKHPAAIGAALMVDRSYHLKVNGFDLRVLLAEDYDYCARISQIGKFRMIRKVKFLYSSRRIEKEGFFQIGFKWLKMGLYTLTNRRITKKNIKYDFGKF